MSSINDDIPENELEFTFYRSSGPGGQKKNTSDSAVRLRHLPTNITVVAQRGRSQHRNKAMALEELKQRLAARRRRVKPRVATGVSRTAKHKRVEEKRKQSLRKAMRGPVKDDD